MPQKVYESEKTAIPWSRRRREAVPSVICVLIGLVLFGISAFIKSDAKGFLAVWGSVIGGVGVFYLIYTVSKTHTTTLTAGAIAEKAADDAAAERRRLAQNAAFNSCLGTIGIWACIIGVAVYWYRPIVDRMNDRITVYPLVCSNWASTTIDKCLGSETVMVATTYTVRVDQQLVVGISADIQDPIKLYNCTVADTRNWSCTGSPAPDSLAFKMHDGNFSFEHGIGLNSYHFTSRLHYLFEKFTH